MSTPISVTPGLFTDLWLRTVSGSSTTQAEQVFVRLDHYYRAAERHYHNWTHVGRCLGFIEEMAEQLVVADEVRLAIWFHDVICIPGQVDNERKSAEFFRQCVGNAAANASLCDRIETLIMATCHCGDLSYIDLAAIADADLGSFCLPWEQFQYDSQNVVKEYGSIDYAKKKTGKVTFLQALLDRPSIYFSPHFQKHYEARARANILRELRQQERR